MANKKITQLASKSSVLSTDLFPIGDANTGTLYKKTIAELQAAIGGAVVSVNGKVGTVVLNTDDVAEAVSPTNLYFTNTRARGAISLTTTGSSGASTYSSSTGVLNVPTYTLAGLGGINASFLSGGTGITYNSGTGVITTTITQYTDALARATISATAPISYNSTTGVITISQATTSTNGYLSSADWNTFNGKQSTITLTTTGTSGAATFSAGTLNIPQYQSVLTNPVTGTGTTNYHTKWTSSSTIGTSLIFDNGTSVAFFNAANGTGYSIEVNNSATAPRFDFVDNGVYTAQFKSSGGAVTLQNNSNNAFIFGTNAIERIRITSGGNVGIGTTDPDFGSYGSAEKILGISNSSARARISLQNTSTGTSGVAGTIAYFNGSTVLASMDVIADGATNSGYYVFYTNSAGTVSEKMRITSGGNILMGTTTNNGERLYVSGNIRATGTITANSDINLKKNLLKIENALEKVEQISGYTYEFKSDDSKRHAGVIAQEIQGVLPEIVNKGNDGLLGVEYGNISALLIEAIKEQQKKIQELEVKLIALGQ